jgi:hypothetical protein
MFGSEHRARPAIVLHAPPMTYDELVASLSEKTPPKGASDPIRAIWLAKKGDWDGAHRLVDSIRTSMGSRIHAHLHRVEGDLSNAGYWYRQAGVERETGTLEAEWEKLARELTS